MARRGRSKSPSKRRSEGTRSRSRSSERTVWRRQRCRTELSLEEKAAIIYDTIEVVRLTPDFKETEAILRSNLKRALAVDALINGGPPFSNLYYVLGSGISLKDIPYWFKERYPAREIGSEIPAFDQWLTTWRESFYDDDSLEELFEALTVSPPQTDTELAEVLERMWQFQISETPRALKN